MKVVRLRNKSSPLMCICQLFISKGMKYSTEIETQTLEVTYNVFKVDHPLISAVFITVFQHSKG